jgi:hypothetical protein
MSSKSNYNDLKMSLAEKKLKDYRNRVNSLSNIPRSEETSVSGEKRRCVSESNASVNGIASLASLNCPTTTVPSIPLSPTWDLVKLAHDSDFLALSAAKEMKKFDTSKNGGLVAWIRKWSRKKQIGKVVAMFDDLLPKLQNTEEEVLLWLTALSEKKESTLVESSNMLKDMETSIGVYESYVDFYDELINDCLKISLDVSRELSDLRIAGAFNEVYLFPLPLCVLVIYGLRCPDRSAVCICQRILISSLQSTLTALNGISKFLKLSIIVIYIT